MMKKEDVINALGLFISSSDCNCKGQRAFTHFLMQYLEENEMPGDKSDFTYIGHHFHDIIFDAAILFRTSDAPNVVELRENYIEETGHQVPDFTSFEKHSTMFVQTCMQFIADKIFGDGSTYISTRIDALCNAHWHALDQIFRKFILSVWRTGVCELIEDTNERGVSGEFGDVKLLTYTIIGRTVIQFDKEDGSSINFTAEENDHMGYRAGINYCETDLHTACAMIQTVIDNWPKDKTEQAKIFFPDKEVKHWAVAAMEAQDTGESNSEPAVQ